MKKILILLSIVLAFQANAQVNWSDDVAEIFFDNCTACHRPNGIGPFSLLTYDDAVANSAGLDYIVSSGYMPPWHADTDYQNYAHERVLTSEEIIQLTEWVNTGTLSGDLADAPPAPVYPEDGFISIPADLEVQIPEYTSNASLFADDYVCFALPLGLETEKKLRGFEVIPGNPQIVHHALMYIDPEAEYETDLSGFCGGPTEGLIGGYTPGSTPTIFPSNGDDVNMGVTIPAGSNIVFAMHYPEGSAGETDATKIRLYFYDDEVEIREISTDPIIQNWTFNLPANEVTDVNAQFGFIPTDISVMSVFPHMHLLGKEIKSYAVTQAEDTIPFVNIPHWDFEWQQFYFFQELIPLPAWSTVYGEGTYDNTVNNPHNPNDPPQDVGAGLNTTDEMFLVYFHYTAYEEGDEDINLEELTQITSVGELTQESNIQVNTFPNPFSETINFDVELERSSTVSLYIYDISGKLVDKVCDRVNYGQGQQLLEWKPEAGLKNGVYYYGLKINQVQVNGTVVKN